MNLEIRRSIGDRLRESRESAQLKQDAAAFELGVKRQAVSSWEHGKSMPTAEMWMRIAPLYGVSLDYLVFGIRTIPVSRYAVMANVFQQRGIQPTGAAFGTPERQQAS